MVRRDVSVCVAVEAVMVRDDVTGMRVLLVLIDGAVIPTVDIRRKRYRRQIFQRRMKIF
jgi:hypothetical protein